MTTKITIDPITRIMGPLSIEVEIKKNKIVNAKAVESSLEVLKRCW